MTNRVAAFLSFLLLARPAFAQEKPTYIAKHKQTTELKKKNDCKCEEEKKKEPSDWEFKLRVGTVFQLSSNKNVVGQVDGTTRSFNASVHGQANFSRGRHLWRSRMDAQGVVVKTQNTRRWVPATDFVELETIYQFRARKWVGPFVRLGLNTSLFIGRDLRTNSVQYRLPGGMLTGERTEFRLSDPFLPLSLLESVGVFFNPLAKHWLDLDIRFGIGSRQVFANGQIGVDDDDETQDIVELVSLNSYTQAGVELVTMFRGELFDETLYYYSGAEFLLPLIRSKEPGDNRSNIDLLNKVFRLGVGYKLAKRATVLYEIRLVNRPQLIDRYQIQNSVGLKGSFDLL